MFMLADDPCFPERGIRGLNSNSKIFVKVLFYILNFQKCDEKYTNQLISRMTKCHEGWGLKATLNRFMWIRLSNQRGKVFHIKKVSWSIYKSWVFLLGTQIKTILNHLWLIYTHGSCEA